MKLKLIAGAIALSLSSLANASLVVDAGISYVGSGAQTGNNGSIAAGVLQYLTDPVLISDGNKPTYGFTFTIAAAPVIAGYTFSHTQWKAYSNAYAGGYATTQNPAGTYINDFSVETTVKVGTTFTNGNLLSTVATAGNGVAGGADTNGDPAYFAYGTTWDLTTDNVSNSNSGFVNLGNAFVIRAFMTAADSFSSDGNSASVYANYGNVAVLAQYVYDQTTVPEPVTSLLVGAGLLGLAASRRKKA